MNQRKVSGHKARPDGAQEKRRTLKMRNNTNFKAFAAILSAGLN